MHVLTRIHGLALALGLASLACAAPAQAQVQTCDQRQNVIGHLAKKYQEAPVAVGVTSTGGLVEVLTTSSGDTWTIIVSSPNGVSCLLAAGEGWRAIEFEVPSPEPQA